MMNQTLRREHGQSIVIITLLMVGLIAMLGLVFDGGNAYFQRRRMQNAADAGAFGGARQLALRPDNSWTTECSIRNVVETYAKSNGTPGPNPDPSCNSLNPNVHAYFWDTSQNRQAGSYEIGLNSGIPSGANAVKVIPQTTFNTFFLGVLNESVGNVSASAMASYGSLQSPPSLQPLATKCDQPSLAQCGFLYNTVYDIWNGGGPGNFGWLSWDGSNSAKYLREELVPGNPVDYVDPKGTCTQVKPGCWFQGSPGVEASADGNMNTYWKQTGNVMIVPIWDTSEGRGSNTNYHVTGFAAFIVTDFKLTGQGYIKGKFVRWVDPGELCASGCVDTGLSGVNLTQ